MELFYWQMVATVATVVAVLAVIVMGSVIFADHATYRRAR